MDNLPTTFWRRWYVYAYFPAAIVVFILGTVVVRPFGDSAGVALLMLTYAFWLVGIGAAIWAFVGYYYDAKVLKQADANWRPTWWAWAIAHMILSPAIVAPFYLFLRTVQTGTPWKNGYSLR